MSANSSLNNRQADWESQAQMLRAIAHPVRLQILDALRDGPLCVNDVNALVSISQPQLSQHMAALRKLGIVACHINGPLRCYYVSRPTLVKRLLRICAEEHPVVEKDRATVVREAAKRRGSGST